jgi:hypothetical protein
MNREAKIPKCPVCGAKFRGSVICSRCGGNLGPLMQIAGRAWLLRRQAIAALLSGDPDAAFCLIQRARKLHDTSIARKIELIVKALRHSASRAGETQGTDIASS